MKTYKDIVALEGEALDAAADGRHRDALLRHCWALDAAMGLDVPQRPALVAVLFERLGHVLESRGNVQDAVIAYERGLAALDEGGAFDLDDALRRVGEVGKSYRVHEAQIPDLYSPDVAQDLDAAVADPSLAMRLLVDQGNAYLRQPQEKPAFEAYQQALLRPEAADAPVLRAYALANSGEILRRRGQVGQAESALTEAVELLDAHGDPVEKRRALALLAGIARDRGQFAQAEVTYHQALDLYAQTDDPLGEGRTWAGLGRLYLDRERFDDAEAAYVRALELVTSAGGTHVVWHIHWGLGRCQREAGRWDEAAVSLEHSLRGIRAHHQGLRTDEGKVTFLDSVHDVYGQLIAVHLERARAKAGAYEQALRVAEDARGQALLDLMEGRGRRRPPPGGTIRPSRLRSFGASSPWAQVSPGVPSPPPQPGAETGPAHPPLPDGVTGQIARAIGIEPVLPDLASFADSPALTGLPEAADAGSAAGDEAAGLLASLEGRTEQMARSVGIQPASALADAEPPAALEDKTPAPAPPPLARLVFYVLADRTAVFAVTPGGAVRGHVVDWGREALSERVTKLREALGADEELRGMRWARDVRRTARPASADPRPLLRELYDGLVAPLVEKLPVDGTPVVIEPHGALWLLPFAALLAPDGTWMADRWPLLYAPSARVVDEIRKETDYGTPDGLEALVVGNPSMPVVPSQDGLEVELDPLPGAEAEARAIADLFPGRCTLLLGAEADREAVATLAGRHGILHLATHGIAYADTPLASFVALGEAKPGEGLLTARHVLDMSLPADLVVLSACQTALGHVSGDGMIGLSRAFLVAGARAVLVSQWSVSDKATVALMEHFYRAYLREDNKAAALQQAMRALWSVDDEYAHPRYWAPFCVVGAEF